MYNEHSDTNKPRLATTPVTSKHRESCQQPVVDAVNTLGDPCRRSLSDMKMHAVICSGAEWPLCMFNECVIKLCCDYTHITHKGSLLCDNGVFVCLGLNIVWVAVGSLVCRVNLILLSGQPTITSIKRM